MNSDISSQPVPRILTIPGSKVMPLRPLNNLAVHLLNTMVVVQCVSSASNNLTLDIGCAIEGVERVTDCLDHASTIARTHDEVLLTAHIQHWALEIWCIKRQQ